MICARYRSASGDIIDLTVHLTEKAVMGVRVELIATISTWNRGELEQ